MTTIKCDSEFCKHNQLGYCTANVIQLNIEYMIDEICDNYEEQNDQEH